MSLKGKIINCKAAVLWKEGQPVSVETIEVDPPKKGEIRVRLVSAGVCATDAHFVWGWPTDLCPDLKGNPLVLGHEGAGVVESIGEGVKSVKEGDKVMILWMPHCEKCRLCLNPKTNACLAGNLATLYMSDGGTRMRVKGKPLLSFGLCSAFSQYSVVKECQLAKLSDEADLRKVCIIGCAVGTGYGSATNLAKVHKGSVCAIWGLGAIGLSAVMGCRANGAKEVIGIDLNPDKEVVSKQLGCTRFVKSFEELQSLLKEEKLDLDYAFDCVGNQKVLSSAQKVLADWGSLIIVGLAPKGSEVTVSVEKLLNGSTVVGGFFGGEKSRPFNQLLVDKHVHGQLNIEPMITCRRNLEDINMAFDDLKQGKQIRTVIDFD